MQTTNPSFFIAGGTVPSDAPCYVTRQADNELFQALQNAEFCFVLDTRQVGKSSLMARTAERLRASGVRVALLDLTALGKESNPENWYYGLLELIGQELRCLRPLRAFWETNPNLPLTQRFMQAIEQVALEKEPTPLVLAIDEIDFVRSLPFDTDDFFAGIRECHNRRAHQPALKRLTFCLIGSATPNDLIQNVHITPFNVGRRVTITDFTAQEATPLADGLNSAGKDGKTLVAQILYWTNGHPYLTQKLCAAAALDREVSGAGDIDGLAKRLFLSRRASATEDVNLAFVRDRLLKSDLNKDRLFGLYQAVHAEKRAIADDPRDPYCNALRLSGIVAERAGYLFVRNRIYRELFTPSWAQEQMPGIEAAQRRREVWRARLQVAGVAGCIIAGMGGLAYNANQQYQRANNTASKLQIALNDADNSRNSANKNAQKAREEAAEAARQKSLAENQKAKADKQKAEADRQRRLAEQRKNEADKSKQKLVKIVDTLGREKKKATNSAVKAKQSAVAARQEADRAERFRYIATMNLIQREYEATNINNALRLLEETRHSPCRGFEWGYWNRLCHLDLFTCREHTAPILSVAFSPDGKQFVTGTGAGYSTREIGPDGGERKAETTEYIRAGTIQIAKVWNATTGKLIFTLTQHGEFLPSVIPVAFSPNGKWIVTGGVNDTAKIWDAATGKELFTLKGHTGAINVVAFSPDGNFIATGSDDKTAGIWDARSGQVLRFLKNVHFLKHIPDVFAVAFSPDSKRLVLGSHITATMWEVNTGKLSFTLEPRHTKYVESVAFSPDGTQIVTASSDNTARTWDATTGKELKIFRGHSDRVNSVAFSPDGKQIVTGSWDKTAKVWDVTTGTELYTLRGHDRPVTSVCFSPDSKHILTGSDDKTAKIWDTTRPGGIPTFTATKPTDAGQIGFCPIVAISPDNKKIVAGTDNAKTAKIWDISTGRELLNLKGLKGEDSFTSILFSPDCKKIVTGTSVGTTKVWNAVTGEELRTLREHSQRGGIAIAFSPDGEQLLTTNQILTIHSGKEVRLWDINTGREIRTLRGSGNWISSVGFTSDGKQILIADSTMADDIIPGLMDEIVSCRAEVWDTSTGKLQHTFKLVKEEATSISPNGKYIATTPSLPDAQQIVKVYDSRTGKTKCTLKGFTTSIQAVAFSPDGKRIVTGSLKGSNGEGDNMVKVWDVETGRELLTLKGHTGSVGSVVFSADGTRIVTGSTDGTAKVWIGE